MTKGNVRRRLAFFRLRPCATSTGTRIGQCVEKTEQKKRGGWKLVGEAVDECVSRLFWSKGQRNALVLLPWPTFFQPRRPSETRFQFPFFTTRRPLFLSLSRLLRCSSRSSPCGRGQTRSLFVCPSLRFYFVALLRQFDPLFHFFLYIKHFWKL